MSLIHSADPYLPTTIALNNDLVNSTTTVVATLNDLPHSFPILENAFGLLGTLFSSFQLVPQAIKNWRRKSTEGLSSAMMLLWAFSSFLFGIYALLLKLSIPLLIQPQLFEIISLLCFVQCVYYEHEIYHLYGSAKGVVVTNNGSNTSDLERIDNASSHNDDHPPKQLRTHQIKCTILFLSIIILSAGVQVGIFFGIKEANAKKISWPETILGSIPVALLFIGYIPQYYRIYRNREVRGVSLIFMTFDMTGSASSTISLAFRPPPFDFIASLVYICVFSCDLLIVVLYHVLRWIKRRATVVEEEESGEKGDDR